jgi:hypothetical protein
MTWRQLVTSAASGAAAARFDWIGRVFAKGSALHDSVSVLPFGTVVDWRGSIIGAGQAFASGRGIPIDWARVPTNPQGGLRRTGRFRGARRYRGYDPETWSASGEYCARGSRWLESS